MKKRFAFQQPLFFAKLQYCDLAQDMTSTIRQYRRWLFVAWLQTKRQYIGTILGPFWITLSNFAFIACISILYSGVLSVEGWTYFAYLAIGYINWLLIADIVNSCTNYLEKERAIIQQVSINFAAIAAKNIAIRVFVFAHSLPIIALAVIFTGPSIGLVVLSLLGICYIIFNGWIFVCWIAILAARFKDIPIIITTIMRLMFFLTPVIWFKDLVMEGPRKWFVDLNPFYYMLEITRAPLMGEIPSIKIYSVCCIMMIINIILAVTVYQRYRRFVTFWI